MLDIEYSGTECLILNTQFLVSQSIEHKFMRELKITQYICVESF